jgi:thymidylate kinase
MLVAFDGPSASGKTTLCGCVSSILNNAGISTVVLHSPTNTRLGRFFRVAPDFMGGMPLAHVAVADRFVSIDGHLEAIDSPDVVVIADRYIISALAFQLMDEVPLDYTWSINSSFPIPSTNYVLSAPREVLLERTRRKGHLDRFELLLGSGDSEMSAYERALPYARAQGICIRSVDTSESRPSHIAEGLVTELMENIRKW